jgi:hypothetical protein
MENTLFYTFTTIAQSVAAAFGLLAAFVLFRFQYLDRVLFERSGYLAGLGCWSQDQQKNMRVAISKGNYRAFVDAAERALSLWREHMVSQNVSGEAVPCNDWHERITTVNWAIEVGTRTRRRLWTSLWVTAVTVIGSVVAIPVSHVVAACPCEAWALLWVGVAMVTGCIGTYMYLIAGTLKQEGEES